MNPTYGSLICLFFAVAPPGVQAQNYSASGNRIEESVFRAAPISATDDVPLDDDFLSRLRSASIAGDSPPQSGISNGELDLRGLSDADADKHIEVYLQDWINRSGPITTTIDHRTAILESAAAFADDGQFELAALLYSTWVEHWVNGIVATLIIRDGQAVESVGTIIREVPLRGKLTWLLALLKATPIDDIHRNAILNLSGRRNCFVNYKWPENDVEQFEHPNPELISIIKKFADTIEYLQEYERREIFGDVLHHAKRYNSEKCE